MSDQQESGNPLISVIIPCYNHGGYLGEAIQSVLNQTYRPLEIIVIDDGSTDDTATVAGGYPEVTLISQSNRGLAAARNRGIRESHGELLVFLDADDRLLPEALRAGAACLAAHPECAFAYGQFRLMNEDGTSGRVIDREPASDDPYLDFLRVNRIAMHATVIYRRSVFDRVGSFNTALRACEDYELYFRIARYFPVAEHRTLTAEYRRHSGGMSNNARPMLESVLMVLRAEHRYAVRDPERLAAYQEGRRKVTGFYTQQLIRNALPPRIKRETWRWALADLWWLVRSHPGGLIEFSRRIPTIIESRLNSRGAYASTTLSAGGPATRVGHHDLPQRGTFHRGGD